MSPALLPIFVAGAVLMVLLAIGVGVLMLLRGNQQRRIRGRLLTEGADPVTQEAVSGSVLAGLAESGRAIERLVDTDNETPRLLAQAGWRSGEQRTLYYVAQLVVPIVTVSLVGFAWLLKPAEAPALNYVMYFIVALFGGLLAPRFLLRKRAAARQARIAGEVPLFIHLLVLLFDAGLSTRQALASLVREGRGTLPELNQEFTVVLRQLEAGGDSAAVLKNLEEALEVSELANVLGVLRQVDRYGGEVRESLLESLSVLEERRSMTTREKVNATSGRMTVVMVLFFFPALLVFVAGPAFVSIIKALGNVGG